MRRPRRDSVTALGLRAVADAAHDAMLVCTADNIVIHANQAAADLFDVVAGGQVRIEVNQTYPLAEASRAHTDLEARKTTGSTVLLP